ncbi:N-lysine methyltransferase KMT5A-A [Trichoplax sp. H2]|uniref:[histone H4]-lysine(20) N-methyltransferase n=1 Tax=Trichoplax adhaerens TaxID=10228 RepID=B3S4E8_TRIAD|nr:hypothetical protein TRIADDRAFT_59058 [Trichoplax adhaerens]EDV22448.1 hypothetical protein TRIADDRAFT_59058 [Trichoplax adhaerens]RDD41109.1 N-lysine methyltransferase KMT5A-A [Trichoplax sp. H2]|eukprot:XP_002114992.1 hypothetical protein TRIADDRAFT_59058 [Trichoplax adhaerens]
MGRKLLKSENKKLPLKANGEALKRSHPSVPPLQTKITDLFPVRRSTRKCKSDLKNAEEAFMIQYILTNKEDGIQMIYTEGKGRGIVTTKPFKKGDFLCEYAGELISRKEALQREVSYGKDPNIGNYMYFFSYKGSDFCVDATKETDRLGRLVNHSRKNYNSISRLIPINGNPHLVLIAYRDIGIGEELLYDYGDHSKKSIEAHPWLEL